MTADPEALDLLLRICESEPAEVLRQWITSTGLEVQFDLLTGIGALRHVENASIVRCYACDETHEASVEMVSPGQFRAYCSDAGFQQVLAHEVEVYAIDMAVLAALIRRGLQMQTYRAPDEVVKGSLWWLGERRFGRILASVYFARQVGGLDALDSLNRALRACPRRGPGVIFTSSALEPAHQRWLAGHVIAPLTRYAELVGHQLRLDQDQIGAALRGDDVESYAAVQFASDYRQARIGQDTYEFTPKQALAIRVMHEAHRRGAPRLTQHLILESAESDQKRLAHLFRGSAAWGTLIKGDGKGSYWLDL